MAGQSSPVPLRTLEPSDNVRRGKKPAEQEPRHPGSTHQNGYQQQPRKSSLTSAQCTNYAPEDEDTDTEVRQGGMGPSDSDANDGQHDESLLESAPSQTSTSAVQTVVANYRSFVDGAYEPPVTSDLESQPNVTTKLDDTETPVASPSPRIRRLIESCEASVASKEIAIKALKHFPPRAHLPVQVVDFYGNHAKRKLISLAEIEVEMDPRSKPPGVEVRWIHAPLGVGMFHSSVEDIFLHGPNHAENGHWRRRHKVAVQRGKEFAEAGRAGWPYLEAEIVNVRSMRQMKEAREAARDLLGDEKAQQIVNRLVFDLGDHDSANDKINPTLNQDVEWRSVHLGKGHDPSFWETAYSDLPLLLSDGALIMKSPAATNLQPDLEIHPQTLQGDPAYKYAYLARDSFRCFHRGDGFLLTLSPYTGIDYLNRHLPEITENCSDKVNHCRSKYKNLVEKEIDKKFPNDSLSVISYIFKEFEDGTQRWQHKNAEWLAVFLMTEIACTPHSMRSGYSIATILDAYDTHVSKLIRKKFEPWTRNETAELFKSYLKTIDELRTLGKIHEAKLDFLKRLNEDCIVLQRDFADSDVAFDGKQSVITMAERIQFALRKVGDLNAQCKALHTDLVSSLDLMSRLRVVEQNDLGISADAQGRAILILSAVTIIFLPLSFLASFFSMNVQGLSETPPPTTLGRFWRICAGITVVLGFLVSVFLWEVSTGNTGRALAIIARRYTHSSR